MKNYLCLQIIYLFIAFSISNNVYALKYGLGSCLDQRWEQNIWSSIEKEDIDGFIFLGDNVYGDLPSGKLTKMKQAYETQRKKLPNWLMNDKEILAIWDDHDFGLNDGGGNYPLKKSAEKMFLNFWNIPSEDPRRKREGIYFNHIKEIDGIKAEIIGLDTRYFRSELRGKSNAYKPNFDFDFTDDVNHKLGDGNEFLVFDFDNDGDSDIVVVGEWMPITVIENQQGQFTKQELNTNLGCSSTGWWYSVEVGDLNNDNLPDLIVGNLGLNYKYKASVDEPFEVFYDDFDDNGKKDIVLAYYNYGIQFPLRGFSCSSQQVPDLQDKFKKYDIFASLDVQQVYGEENLENALRLSVNTFESATLINNKSFFDFRPLPNYAQFSSVNDIIIKDFDNDKVNDLLIVGNMYHAEIETARNDAGNGLLLKGNGDGSFNEIPTLKSGFFTPGDSKKAISLTLGNKEIILVANNDDRLQIFK